MYGPPVPIDKKKSLYADLVLLICALIWGGDYPVTKGALACVSPLFMNGVRFMIAFIIMAAMFPRRTFSIRLPDLVPGLFLGITMFGAFTFHTIGLQFTMSGTAAFLTATYVVFVPFIMWFIDRKFPGLDSLLSSALCILGVYFLTGTGQASFGKGELLTLVSAVFFALNIISAGYFAKRTDPVKMTLVETGVGALLFMGSAVIFEPVSFILNGSSVSAMAYLIILGTLGTHLVANTAMRYTPETHASISFSLEAVFALILGVLFLDDAFSPLMLAGCAIIFASVLTTELEPVRRLGKRGRTEDGAPPASSAGGGKSRTLSGSSGQPRE